MEDHEQNRPFAKPIYVHSIVSVAGLWMYISIYKYTLWFENQALMEKYKSADLVDDLIARKTEGGLFINNPDFPGNEETPCMSLCVQTLLPQRNHNN